MPEVSFGFPFGGAANPHAERVRVEHIAWVQEMRLVEEGAGLRDYVALDIPWAAAACGSVEMSRNRCRKM